MGEVGGVAGGSEREDHLEKFEFHKKTPMLVDRSSSWLDHSHQNPLCSR